MFCGLLDYSYTVPITAWLYSHVFEPTWSILEMLRFYMLPMDEDEEYETKDFETPPLSILNRRLPELQDMNTATLTKPEFIIRAS